MAKQDKSSRSGFVIKLSSETVQKLSEEEQQAKTKSPQILTKNDNSTIDSKCDGNTAKPVENISSESSEQTEVMTKKNYKDELKSKETDLIKSNLKETSAVNLENKCDPTATSTEESNNYGDYAPYVTYEGEDAVYTEPSTQQKFTWNKGTNAWDPTPGQEVPGREYSYENDTHIYTETDGSKFFWDAEKKAWIPKVDDDFLAFYQMSYGFVDNSSKDPEKKDEKKKDEEKKESVRKSEAAAGVKRKAEPQWFDPSEETNTKVYVSNLPLELTEEEFVDFMQKCGLVERDRHTQKMKVKLYMDKEQNCFKGDALCTYIKIESVDLALKLLDGGDLKGNKVKVERAHFQLKGEYNPALKPKKKKKKELEKIKKMQQKLFDWRPEKFKGERSKHERVVIIKNLFHPSDFDNEVQLILDYQQDMREECSKAGEVRKVVIYDRHPEGVAQVTMKEPEMADAVVQLVNGRWFGKRQITAEIWDGRTKYRIAETDADIGKRIDKWGRFLEGKEEESKTADKDKEVTPDTEHKSGDSTPTEAKDTENKGEDSTPPSGAKDTEHKSEDSTPPSGAKDIEHKSVDV